MALPRLCLSLVKEGQLELQPSALAELLQRCLPTHVYVMVSKTVLFYALFHLNFSFFCKESFWRNVRYVSISLFQPQAKGKLSVSAPHIPVTS